jgi:hypothetical protein
MRIGRFALLLLGLLTLPTMSPVWASDKDKHIRVKEYEEGHAFCPSRALVIGNTIVPAGRCYELAVLRDNRGAFLAFMDPSVRIPSGKIERLDSSEGRKARGHIFFLVPIQNTAQIALVPVNTIQLIRLREEDEEDEDEEEHAVHVSRSTLIVVLPNLPIPNVSVTFVVTF